MAGVVSGTYHTAVPLWKFFLGQILVNILIFLGWAILIGGVLYLACKGVQWLRTLGYEPCGAGA